MKRNRLEKRKNDSKAINRRLNQAKELGLLDEKIEKSPHILSKNVPWVCNNHSCKAKSNKRFKELRDKEFLKLDLQDSLNDKEEIL